MQTGFEKNEKSLNSPQLLWENILRVTEKIGSQEAKAVRIPLYMFLASERMLTLQDRLRCYRKVCRLLITTTRRQVAKVPKNRPLFAFIFDTPSNMNNILPVFQAARRRDWDPWILLGDGFSVDQKHLEGVTKFTKFYGLVSLTTVKERLEALNRANRYYDVLFNEFESVGPYLANIVQRLRLHLITELTLFIIISTGVQRLYAGLEPSCVISTSDFWPFEHAVFAEARRVGIPSFVIQHGTTTPFWWPFVADKLLLWGEPFRDEILKLGAPSSRLAVCGMPATDSMFSKHKGKFTFSQYMPKSSYVILSNTQDRFEFRDLYLKYKKFLKSVVAAVPSVQWNVKLHPIEDESFYRDILDSHFNNFKILPKSTSLEEGVAQAEVACSLNSTAGLEAMVMRKPLVVFDIDPMIRQSAWWPKRGGGIYVKRAEEMTEFVRKSAADNNFVLELLKKQDDFLSMTFANQGRAAEAVLNVIEETLGSVYPSIS